MNFDQEMLQVVIFGYVLLEARTWSYMRILFLIFIIWVIVKVTDKEQLHQLHKSKDAIGTKLKMKSDPTE